MFKFDRRVIIAQINSARDDNSLMYESYENTICVTRGPIDASIYDVVFDGQVEEYRDLEDLFCYFQRTSSACPQEFEGRSMSVSDIVIVDNVPYFCDRIGFKECVFDIDKANNPKRIATLVVEPGKTPRISTIRADLKAYQQTVGGYIEIYFPFDNKPMYCIVCNDSGKINNMTPNRAIYDEDGNMIDVIFGPFFICNGHYEDLRSGTKKDLMEFYKQFKQPETLVYTRGHVEMIKMEVK